MVDVAMECFEQRLWSLNPSAKLRLTSGHILPMHKEIATLGSPVLAALLYRGTEDKDRCTVVQVPKDWAYAKQEAKQTWLLWLAFVYAPHLGPVDKEIIGSLSADKAKDLLQLADLLKSAPVLIDRIRSTLWSSLGGLVEIIHPETKARWVPVRWLGAADNTSYTWHICDGVNGSEHRWCTRTLDTVNVLRMTANAAQEFRTAYLKVIGDALNLVPLAPCDEVARTARALLACEWAAGHTELMQAVMHTCGRCPKFQRAYLTTSLTIQQLPLYDGAQLYPCVVNSVTCQQSSVNHVQAIVEVTAVPAAASPSQDSTVPLSPVIGSILNDIEFKDVFC
eukprot:jgi/Chrzof1/12753/Cz07g06090.t1